MYVLAEYNIRSNFLSPFPAKSTTLKPTPVVKILYSSPTSLGFDQTFDCIDLHIFRSYLITALSLL